MRVIDVEPATEFSLVRPGDGKFVACRVQPQIVEADDGTWEFKLVIENAPPRGGATEWTVSKVMLKEENT